MSAGFEHNVTVQMFWCLVFLKYKLTFDLGHPVSGIHAESVILTEMSQLAPYLSVRCHVNRIQPCLFFFSAVNQSAFGAVVSICVCGTESK